MKACVVGWSCVRARAACVVQLFVVCACVYMLSLVCCRRRDACFLQGSSGTLHGMQGVLAVWLWGCMVWVCCRAFPTLVGCRMQCTNVSVTAMRSLNGQCDGGEAQRAADGACRAFKGQSDQCTWWIGVVCVLNQCLSHVVCHFRVRA
jgi:hypothetical protein